MNRKLDFVFILILLILLVSVPAGILLGDHSGAAVLFYENRTPAVVPRFNSTAILDGSYINQVDDFISDRTGYRKALISLKTKIDLDLGRPVVNNLVVQENLLLPYHGYSTWDTGYISDDSERMAESLTGVQEVLDEYGGKLFYLGLPQQYSYFGDEYPDYMDNRSWVLDKIHSEFSSALSAHNISFIDMLAVYKNLGSPAEYYSFSDHHYTYEGMLVAYRELMRRINNETGLSLRVYSKDDLTYTTLPNPFLGSLNRQLYGLWQSSEKLETCTLKDPIEFTRYDNGEKVASTLYAMPSPEETATYNVYMGGDIGETIIQTGRPELPSVLIWGDSYTNPLETILWASFDEMRSLDLRYYTDKTLKQYILDYKPDIVICVRDDTSFLDFDGNGNIFKMH